MENQEKLIKVTGRGGIHIVPDVTRLELSLITLHDSYEEAYEQGRADTEKLGEIMKAAHLSTQLPKTTQFDIDKRTITEYDKNDHYKGEKFLGFRLTHIVKIDLDMDNVLLNQIVQSIGKNLRQAEINIGYTVKDQRPSQLRMLERAVKDAREKAEIMAKAAGCRLGMCKSIDYSLNQITIYSQARSIHGPQEACCCNEASLDITPDDLAVSDTVNTVWYLEENNPHE